jgi:hypothetical protein
LISTESALSRLDECIERQLPTLNPPGLALGVTHREQIVHVGVYGLVNQEAGKPVTPENLSLIGSISKSLILIFPCRLFFQEVPIVAHLNKLSEGTHFVRE